MSGEEWARRGRGQLLELANARVRALPDRERRFLASEGCAESCDEDGANVVLRSALREQLQEDEVVVTVGDDAGKIVGLGEDEAVRIVGRRHWRKLATKLQRSVDAGAQVGKVLGAAERGRARDEARGDGGCRRIERGAQRNLARVGDRDQRPRLECRGGLLRFEIGAIDPEMAGAKPVSSAACNAECGCGRHLLQV